MRCLASALAVVLFLAPPVALAGEPAIDVRVDERVELFSILFRLAGNPEYNQGRVASYVADVEKHFGPHRDHAAVEVPTRLTREQEEVLRRYAELERRHVGSRQRGFWNKVREIFG